MFENADAGDDLEIAHEHAAEPRLARRLAAGGRWGHRHGVQGPLEVASGVCQAKCWPPSRASICPVSAGASRIKRMAAAISSGAVLRPSSVAWYSARNSASV